MRMSPRPGLDRIWAALRAATDPMLPSEMADATGVSTSYARRILREWARAGFADCKNHVITDGPLRSAGHMGAYYTIAAGAPDLPPAVRHHASGGAAVDVTPAMTGAEFAGARARLGLSVIGMARALGWRGHRVTMSKNIRRLEAGARRIDDRLAERVRRMVAAGG